MVSRRGVEMDPKKVFSVLKWATPQNLKGWEDFWG